MGFFLKKREREEWRKKRFEVQMKLCKRRSLFSLFSLVLVSLEDSDSLVDLALEGLLVLQHVNQLRVVDLEQHAGDLAGQVRIHGLDEREEALAQHLLLLLWRSGGQHGGRQ